MSALSELLWKAKAGRSIDTIAAQAKQRGHPINRATVAKYLAGDHGPRPPEGTLLALAEGLGIDVRLLRRSVGVPSGELGPYHPVAESARLSQAQREAIDALIKTMVSRGEDPIREIVKGTGTVHDSVTGTSPVSVSRGSAATTSAEAFGGDVYVGEPASAELKD